MRGRDKREGQERGTRGGRRKGGGEGSKRGEGKEGRKEGRNRERRGRDSAEKKLNKHSDLIQKHQQMGLVKQYLECFDVISLKGHSKNRI